jgi:hypothetical protein
MSLGFVLMLSLFAVASTAQFTDWNSPVNLGPVINSSYSDSCTAISKNGLSLFFSSNRQTGDASSLDRDLYVSQRETVKDAWGPAVPLTMLNTTSWDSCPALSLDEHRLYFTSRRAGGCGLEDIWVSRRQDRRDDFVWEPPVHLACDGEGGVNSVGRDLAPAFFEDDTGKVLMYFISTRPGATFFDIYQSEMRDDNTFGPATPVAELNSPSYDMGAIVRRDGLEVIFQSYRPHGTGDLVASDFWVATRESTADRWSEPVFIPSLGNPALAMGGRIALSFDGRELYFTSVRSGGSGSADLYVARRERLPGKKLNDKDLCKDDGWRNFTDPVFKNQGECVSHFVSSRP